jgi:site-specific DNA recombinase
MHSTTGRGRDCQSLDSDVLANEKSASMRSAISVPQGRWLIRTEFSVGTGANLQPPGLEALRDLAAQGQMTTVLIYSPDRLSRKYAYQVLRAEELAGCGVDIVFLKSPSGGSPEDQLVV